MRKLSLKSLNLDECNMLSTLEKKKTVGGNYCGGEWIQCPGSYPGHCVLDESECWDSYPQNPGGNPGGGNPGSKCEDGGYSNYDYGC